MTLDYKLVGNEDLYAMCQRGDQGAWGHVYGYVLAIARRPQWNLREAPEDMAQSIVLFLLEEGIHKAKEPAAFRGFVKRVAVNKILDSFKKPNPGMESIHPSSLEGERHVDPPSEELGPEETAICRNLMRTISRLLDDLPDYCRKAVPGYFRFRLGMVESYQELSELLGASVGTISAQVKRCMDMLAKCPELRSWL